VIETKYLEQLMSEIKVIKDILMFLQSYF